MFAGFPFNTAREPPQQRTTNNQNSESSPHSAGDQQDGTNPLQPGFNPFAFGKKSGMMGKPSKEDRPRPTEKRPKWNQRDDWEEGSSLTDSSKSLGILGGPDIFGDKKEYLWESTKFESCMRAPVICASAIVCSPCYTCIHRKRLLNNDMSQYICFGGGSTKKNSGSSHAVTGFAAQNAQAVMKFNPCCYLCVEFPQCALCLEVGFCFPLSMDVNGRIMRGKFGLEDTESSGCEGKCLGSICACGGNLLEGVNPICKLPLKLYKFLKNLCVAPWVTTQHHVQLKHEGYLSDTKFGIGIAPSIPTNTGGDYVKATGDTLPMPFSSFLTGGK